MFARSAILLSLATSAFFTSAVTAAGSIEERSNSLEERTFWKNFDVNNCGGPGVRCKDDPNGDAVCNYGVCSISCDDSCFFSSFSNSCQPNLPSSCGVSGTKCTAPVANGKATCNNGVCGVQCYGSTTYNKAKNTCEVQYTQNTCGFFGTSCSNPANGYGFCYFGVCQFGCNSGYVPDSSTNTCVKQGGSTTSCPKKDVFGFTIGYENCNNKFSGYTNGVASCGNNGCVYTCNDGYESNQWLSSNFGWFSRRTFGSSSYCVPTTNNNDCCGSSGKKCIAPANGSASCQYGTCQYSCNDGYDYDTDSGTCVAINNTGNCGRCGNPCWAPRNGYAKCNNGQCSWSCNPGYVANGNCCVPGSSSKPKAKAKRASQKAYSLCPSGESACPIAGSASFATHGSSKEAIAGAINNGLIGYECLDTTSSIESCGGCASTGEGVDCTQIPHVEGVGCAAGKCIILQCSRGYKLSVDGDKCLPSHPHHKKKKTKL